MIHSIAAVYSLSFWQARVCRKAATYQIRAARSEVGVNVQHAAFILLPGTLCWSTECSSWGTGRRWGRNRSCWRGRVREREMPAAFPYTLAGEASSVMTATSSRVSVQDWCLQKPQYRIEIRHFCLEFSLTSSAVYVKIQPFHSDCPFIVNWWESLLFYLLFFYVFSDVFLTQFSALQTSRSVRTRRLAAAEENTEVTRTARLAHIFKEIWDMITSYKGLFLP